MIIRMRQVEVVVEEKKKKKQSQSLRAIFASVLGYVEASSNGVGW